MATPLNVIAIRGPQPWMKEWKARYGLVADQPAKYNLPGNVRTNSPGEGQRIRGNSDLEKKLTNKPGSADYADRYKATYAAALNDYKISPVPSDNHVKLLSLAFNYLLTSDTASGNYVKAELIAQANEPTTQFDNRTKFPLGASSDNGPAFATGEWLTRLLQCYACVWDLCSGSERTFLNGWFENAANYIKSNPEKIMNEKFGSNWHGENPSYALTTAATNSQKTEGELMYFGGPKARHLAKQLNNRMSSMVQYVGLWGVFSNNTGYMSFAEDYFKAWLVHAVYPTGDVGEFHRGVTDTNKEVPYKGPGYAWGAVYHYARVSLALDIVGRPMLKNFSTLVGRNETVVAPGGTPKSLALVTKRLLNITNNTPKLYATKANPTDKDAMDGRNARTLTAPRNNVNFVAAFLVNALLRDSSITAAITALGFPSSVNSIGNLQRDSWGGNGSLVPSLPLQFDSVPSYDSLIAPSNVAITSPSSTSVNVSAVQEDDRITSYVIQSSLDGAIWTDRGTLGVTGNSITGTATGLSSGTAYLFRIKAVGPSFLAQPTVYSAQKSQSTTGGTPAPASPSNLVVSFKGKNKVKGTFTDNSTTETGFRVESSTNGGAWTTLQTLSANDTDFLDNTYVKGTRRQYRVVAFLDAVNSQPGNVAEVNLPVGPYKLNAFASASGAEGSPTYVASKALEEGDGLANRWLSPNTSEPKTLTVTIGNEMLIGRVVYSKGRPDGPRNTKFGMIVQGDGDTLRTIDSDTLTMTYEDTLAEPASEVVFTISDPGQYALNVNLFDE